MKSWINFISCYYTTSHAIWNQNHSSFSYLAYNKNIFLCSGNRKRLVVVTKRYSHNIHLVLFRKKSKTLITAASHEVSQHGTECCLPELHFVIWNKERCYHGSMNQPLVLSSLSWVSFVSLLYQQVFTANNYKYLLLLFRFDVVFYVVGRVD